MRFLQVRPLHLLILVFVPLIWGVNFPVAKISLEAFPPILFTMLRFIIVALCLLPFIRLPRASWGKLLLLSFTLATLHFIFIFSGLDHLDAATTSIIVQLGVPFSTLLAFFVFRDKVGIKEISGIVLSIMGVAILVGGPSMEGHYLGVALVCMGTVMWAISNLIIKNLSSLNGWTINGWMAIFAVPQLFFFSLLFEKDQWQAITTAPLEAWLAVGYTAVFASLVGYGLWYWLMKRYPVSIVVPFGTLVPFFGVTSSILLLGESLTLAIILGGLLTFVGIAVIMIKRPPRKYLASQSTDVTAPAPDLNPNPEKN